MNFFDLFQQLRIYIKSILDPSEEQENEQDTIENIRKGIEFKGTNLWVLIFAIFIASLGLNVNSTAVIIGAMLISPLMGPIMGVGLGLGINDFELIKKSFRNLAVATIFGILTSTLYFLISPLNEARSELLARTTPTIYDVLIAFFGGMAGIFASCTRLKGNVIPGVAIATALMPPLCTAGFGIASGNFSYFFGAFYLYMINSVFIAFATTLGVRLMHFTKKTFVDKNREKKVKQLVYTIIFLTMVPSIYITYNMIKANVFITNATRFVTNEINFPNTLILDKSFNTQGSEHTIKVSLIGKEISQESIITLNQKLELYKLSNTQLIISQGFGEKQEEGNQDGLHNLILQDFYKDNQEKTIRQEDEIKQLRNKLQTYEGLDSMSIKISPELKILFPHIRNIAITKIIRSEVEQAKPDTLNVAIVSYNHKPDLKAEQQFKAWLITRTGMKDISVINEEKY